MRETRHAEMVREYHSEWRWQGARWEVYAQRTRCRRRERCAAALGRFTADVGAAAEAFTSLVPVFRDVVEAFAAFDPRTLETEMTPPECVWSWITDTYYRWIYR